MPKTTVGLDIGYSTIRVVELTKEKAQYKLVTLGSIPTPQPGMNADADNDLEAVAVAIKKVLEAAKVSNREIITSIPESKVFTRVIDDLPYLTDKELASAISYASEEFIPLPVSEVNLNWQVLYRTNPKDKNPRTIVFAIASPKAIINKYINVLNMAGLKTQALETETMAVTRSLVGNNPYSPGTLIIQMGSITTDFAVVSKGLIWLTRSISTGGLSLSRVLAQHFSFEMSQAEEYKKVYGMTADQLDGKVYEILKPIIDLIVQEIKRIIQSFQEKYSNSSIKRIVLSGGGAKMPGLVIYLAHSLGLEVQEADPWFSIIKEKESVTKLAQDASSYSVAVGSALRED